ncbi:hypothetical protein P5V15_009281 [Pogonomyrmex californicus]
MNKYCTHCKKAGHNRAECWLLHGKTEKINNKKLTIKLGKEEIRHSIYVVRDDFPMDYEGILGIDFLAKQKARCDHGKKILSIGKTNLKLQPYQKVLLKLRSETIIEVYQ